MALFCCSSNLVKKIKTFWLQFRREKKSGLNLVDARHFSFRSIYRTTLTNTYSKALRLYFARIIFSSSCSSSTKIWVHTNVRLYGVYEYIDIQSINIFGLWVIWQKTKLLFYAKKYKLNKILWNGCRCCWWWWQGNYIHTYKHSYKYQYIVVATWYETYLFRCGSSHFVELKNWHGPPNCIVLHTGTHIHLYVHMCLRIYLRMY